MKILIGGAGKVGYYIAKSLYIKHDVTIIDTNEEAIDYINSYLDVMTIKGDITNPEIYKKLPDDFDYFLLMTTNDEANITANFIYPYDSKKILRLKKLHYKSIQGDFHATVYFPILLAIKSIMKIIKHPKANNIKEIPFSDFVLVSVYIDNFYDLQDLQNTVYIGIEREGEFIFSPQRLRRDDLLYFITHKENIDTVLDTYNNTIPKEINTALIFGANEIGIELAKRLKEMETELTIIEKDPKTALNASDMLEDVEILQSTYEEGNILEEYSESFDIAITTSNNDETNIIKSLQAKKAGIKKVVTLNNNINYYSIMHMLNLSTIRGPKLCMFNTAIEEIDSQNLIYERIFLGNRGRVFIKKIFGTQEIKPPEKENKAVVIKEDKIFEIKEKTEVNTDDIVLCITLKSECKWINRL